jgi:allantoinase
MFAPVSSLRSSRVVVDGEARPATIHHEGGVIVEIGDGPADDDFGDLVIMPGLVDTHVHVNEPGRTHWEGFDTATRAAAAGGATTIVDMPLNSVPPTVDTDALEAKRESADARLSVDTAFWGGLIPGSEGHLAALVTEGVCGFKSFLVDSGVPEFPPMIFSELATALEEMGRLGVPSLIHAEHPDLLEPWDGDPQSYQGYLATRPSRAETEAVLVLAGLTERIGCRVHVLHVSSGEAASAIGSASSRLTGETCPHYLIFSAEEIPDGATVFKCAPPIRGGADREALWDALITGTLAMVVSDHSPAPPEVKATDWGDFASAWGGIASLQLRLPATWTGAAERGVGLGELTRWLSTAPAALAGLDRAKGSIALGKDADFVVWDLGGVTEVRGEALEHRHPLTAYEGMQLRGRVETTILRGETIFEQGRVASGHGRMLRRG